MTVTSLEYYRRVGRTSIRALPVLLASEAFFLIGMFVRTGSWNGWDYLAEGAVTLLLFSIPVYCTAIAIVHAVVDQTGVQQ